MSAIWQPDDHSDAEERLEMGASETPLTDAKTYDVVLTGYNGDMGREGCSDGSGDHVDASDCRAIERRLNAAVAMLEKLLFWFQTASVVRAEVEEAIANARKPL